jgi:Immunoglobulin-like domain of bacterial spore germination
MTSSSNDDDRTAELLRRVLADEAESVPTDPRALQSIQARIRPVRRRSGGPRWMFAAGGAGLAAAATITAIVLVTGSAGPGHDRTPAAGRTGDTTAPNPSVTTHRSTPTSTATSTRPSQAQQAVMHQGVYEPGSSRVATMYYLGQRGANGAMLLQREPHTVASTGVVTGLEAAHEFLTSTPLDPDYTSGWPAGVDVASIDPGPDNGQTIALTGPARMPAPSVKQADAEAAIQALLHTAQVTGPVSFTYDGKPVSSLLGVDVSKPVPVAPYGTASFNGDLRAMVSITSPVNGQSVSNPVTVSIVGNVFEGTVNWRLTDASGKVLKTGYGRGGTMGRWSDFTVPLPHLSAGTYTITAYQASPMNGKDTFVDTKTFTVT